MLRVYNARGASGLRVLFNLGPCEQPLTSILTIKRLPKHSGLGLGVRGLGFRGLGFMDSYYYSGAGG